MSTVNGVNGVDKDSSESSWKVGLVNKAGKYITAETFGHKINVSGTSLKKRQIFTLVQDLKEEVVYIRSHLGRYLSADKYGNVTCDEEEPGEAEKFKVEYDKGFTGRWAFKNEKHGNYLGGGAEDCLRCFAKNYTDMELWTVQLSINPQVHLRNVNRKRYAHVCDNQVQVTQTIPWEAKSLIFLVFQDGYYLLKTFDGRYLLSSGELSDENPVSPDAKFTMEIRSGQNRGLAFRDRNGCYLTGVGSTATMKSRNKSVTKDELFTLEDTHPQVILVASNDKNVSIKQGVDVTANQEEETEKEIFQMEYDAPSCKWAFRSVDNKYWKEVQGGIQAISTSICPEALFKMEWQEDGSVTLKAPSGGPVYNKRTGSLNTTGGDAVGDKEKRFRVRIANRSALVLKSDYGFVGCKNPDAAKSDVICNRSAFDVINMEDVPGEPGVYYFRGSNSKYWSVTEDRTVVADGSDKAKFQLQVCDNRKLSVRYLGNGCYMKGEQNGLFKAVGEQLESSTMWEY